MARKRASMREGPLAELFRATEAAQRQAESRPTQPEPDSEPESRPEENGPGEGVQPAPATDSPELPPAAAAPSQPQTARPAEAASPAEAAPAERAPAEPRDLPPVPTGAPVHREERPAVRWILVPRSRRASTGRRARTRPPISPSSGSSVSAAPA
jgi:hypothetical protein